MFKACIGLRSRRIDYLDKTHCNLARIPEEVYRNERWLEELILDMNMIQEFPPKFFRLVNLRRLSASENDLLRLPVAIGNLVKLVELNLSKNSIEELPESLASCRSLAIVDFSMNPIMKSPEVLSSMPSLTQIMLNDVALQRLPMDIGNLENLVILEARENLLKMLPTSIGNLRKLKRLDLGNNEIEELPPHVGQLGELEELWLDINSLTTLPQEITLLANLTILDLTKNRLSTLPTGLDHMVNLKDLIVSENFLESVPSTLGLMPCLYQLKLDMNRLFQLPDCFYRLTTLEELFLYDNLLEALPASIFQMPGLRLLNVDRNHLVELPKEVSGVSKLHVLSLRDNELTQLPEDIGNLSQLTVLDVCGNRLGCLPISVRRLNLEALWLIDNQPQPLIELHEEESAKDKLMCSLLPQKGPYNLSMENFLADSDADSNGQKDATLDKEEKQDRNKGLSVAFDPSAGPPEDAPQGKLVRFPTPARRKGGRSGSRDSGSNKKHKPNQKVNAPTSIFKKTKQEDASASTVIPLTTESEVEVKTTDLETANESPTKLRKEAGVGDLSEVIENMRQSPSLIPNGSSSLEATMSADVTDVTPHIEEPFTNKDVVITEPVQRPPSSVSFSSDTVENEGKRATFQRKDTPRAIVSGSSISSQQAADIASNSRPVEDKNNTQNSSTLQTVMVEAELTKEPGRSLGFSIAGGRGSLPAYEDVDDGVFITKIAPGGLAEADGRLRLGDRLLSVNGTDMTSISHVNAVEVLKTITDRCQMTVSREVLIVLPEDVTSPPPGVLVTSTVEGGVDEKAASPTAEKQFNKDTTPPPAQVETKKSPSPVPEVQVNETSPPLEVLGSETSPPSEGQVNEISPPEENVNNSTTVELAVPTVVQSVSMEELQAFNEQLLETVGEVYDKEVVVEQVIEELMPGDAEDQHGNGAEEEKQVEENQPIIEVTVDEADDISELEKFAEQLQRAKEQEMENETQNLNVDAEEGNDQPRDNYVNYDIAQAVISSSSHGSLADSEDSASKRLSVGSGDPPAESSVDSAEVVKSKPVVTEQATAKSEIEVKKNDPKVVEPVTEEVVLEQGSGPLGMNIVGGSDRSSFPFGKGQSGVFISKVTPGGAVAATGKLCVGDQILKVNGVDTKGCSHQEVVDMLITVATSNENTILLVQHDPAPAGLLEVKLRKGPNEKLGVSIRGGERINHSNESEDEGISVKGFHGNPYDAEDEGIFISKISPGGVAAQDGRLQVGHRILEVNGQSLVGASHVAAVRIMKDIQEELVLVVCNGFDPSSEEQFGSTASMHMIQGPPSLHSSTSGAVAQQSDHQLIVNRMANSPIDVTVTEERLDEMLKELEDINKSITSPASTSSSSSSSSDDENDITDPHRKPLSKAKSTPSDAQYLATSNLVTTTSLSSGELNTETSEALKSIHDEMDLLQRQVNEEAEAMLQSTRKRRDSRNYDYQWAEREKERLEQSTLELMERTRTTQELHSQEAARKRLEESERKVREEAEKLAQQRKEEHDRIVQEAVKKIAQEQIQQSPAEHKESLATMITEIFDQGNLQSDFDQFNELPDDFVITHDDKDTTAVHDTADQGNMDDIVKALTDFSIDSEEPATTATTISTALESGPVLVTEQNVVTVSYSQQSPSISSPDCDEKKQPQKPAGTTVTLKSRRSASPSHPSTNVSSSSKPEVHMKPPVATKRERKGQKNNPERLSFVERLQLHEKAVKEETEAAKKLPMNRSNSASTIASSSRPLQKKLAASSGMIDDIQVFEEPLKAAANISVTTTTTRTQRKENSEKQPVAKPPGKVTTSLTISSVKSPVEHIKTSPDHSESPKVPLTESPIEPVKSSPEPSQNPYVLQVLKNMPPVVSCNRDKTDEDDNNMDEELEGLTPAQAKVLQAQQRRVWRANKESQLNEALDKAQAAIESAKEREDTTATTSTASTDTQLEQNDTC